MIARTPFLFVIVVAAIAFAAPSAGAPAMPEQDGVVNPTGNSGDGLPRPRQGAPRSVESVIVDFYDAAAREINRTLAREIVKLDNDPELRSAQFKAQRAAVLARQIDRIVSRMRRESAPAILSESVRAYALGIRQARVQAAELGVRDALPREGGLRALGVTGFSGIDENAVEVLARDTAARVNAGVDELAAKSKVMFRTLADGAFERTGTAAAQGEGAINKAIATGLTQGDPRRIEKLVREVFRDPKSEAALTYRQLGNQQIEVGGWKGTVRSYARTVARTRTREATVAGRHNRLSEVGIDLVQITGRVSLNFCTAYIGLVCALNPTSSDGGRYPLLSSLPGGGPPFHPNCSKGTSAFVPELVSKNRGAMHTRAKREFDRRVASGELTMNLRAA